MTFPRISIIGLGLIGGSVAMAIRNRLSDCKITGYDADPNAVESAFTAAAIHTASSNLKEACASADCIILSVPIGSIGGDHPSDILFTSGTTGAPKGVMSTHARTLRTFGAFNEGYGVRPSDRMAIVNPFLHAFGLKAGWILCLLAGATAYPLPT